MSVASNSPAQKASSAQRRSGRSLASRLFRRTSRPETPVDREKRRIRKSRPGPAHSALNGAKTLLAVFIWTVLSSVQVVIVAPYASYVYAQGALFGMAVSSAVLIHLWPTRTPQWRTLFWAFLITSATGAMLLPLGAGRMALTGATLAGFGFVLLRMNQNGRKLMELVNDWRVLR